MWAGLDSVDWAGLEHNYGSAEDVPGLLRRCTGPNPDDANSAAFDLLNHLFHQGGWICSAAPAALPFLLRLAAAPNVPTRRTVLELLVRLAAEAGQVVEKFLDPGWQPAWERALPEVLALLTDPEPEIRRAAADLIGACGSPGEFTLPALLRCWRSEADPATRLDLILALGGAARREPAGVDAAGTFDLLRELLDASDAQIRLAAVHTLTPCDPTLPARRLDLLLEAVREPGVELWRRTSSVEAGVQGVLRWTAALNPGPCPAFALGLLVDHSDEEQRVGALVQAGGLLAQWRSPTAAILPRLVARLDDPATEVRFRAVELLACLGPAAAAHVDEVAAMIGDSAARATGKREKVVEAALWALARMNDPRCVQGLIEVMAGSPSGFASNSGHYPAESWHHAVLPSVPEVLGYLSDHAEPLLPTIREQLDGATDVSVLDRLCAVLADWGPAAKAAVPQLLGLLEDDRTWTAAAKALVGIGSAGSSAQDLLLARWGTGGPDAEIAAWTYWKVSGEPGPALEALRRAPDEGSIPRPVLLKLADLGSLAAEHADRLRVMTADTDPWTRIEAAHALWAVTGDTDSTVPALISAVRGLAEGTYRPVMLPAVHYLVRIGRAARPAAQLLGSVSAGDHRLRSDGGWRGFTQDETIRTAVEALLTVCEGQSSPGS
ncbi:HEAT repeat domain-containing protein [Streptomyces sp. NBC_01198]|uniref:HEAT repeat domain-containing protein n=1 Tax=Streptomyces sp. NBC_01198 TaxID=2903769 RepID=UPI002E11871D|nr:HEAT repeat domain-containing protein [Streptomyces sp. NBC_01198]